MSVNNNLTGLVVCGGKSARMGSDKSLLTYYKKPQRYHLYDMLSNFCSSVFISCSKDQAADSDLPYIYDAESFADKGPAASLMSAFSIYPGNNFLIVGCDYPFIKNTDLSEFLNYFSSSSLAAAFYNETENLYEPLLGFYSAGSYSLLRYMFEEEQYSLQYFLKSVNAGKYIPSGTDVLISADTPEAFEKARSEINNKLLFEHTEHK